MPTKCPHCAGFGHFLKPAPGSRRNRLIIGVIPIPLNHAGPFQEVQCPECRGFGFVDKAQARAIRRTASARAHERLLGVLLVLLVLLGLLPIPLFVALIVQGMYVFEASGVVGTYATITTLVAVAYWRARRRNRRID